MSGFKDHFSGHAADYARYRPRYAPGMFAWLSEQAPNRHHAWDAGTGNGQVAVALAEHFETVVATDASAEQIAVAVPHPRVSYAVAPAEDSKVTGADLVTVGQALHWFDLDRFWPEVRRALVPGGLVAVWTYAFMHVTPDIDAVLGTFYADVVGPWWPPERAMVERGYAGLDFPFEPVAAPSFAMEATRDLPSLVGYVGTWSATRRFIAGTVRDPLETLVSMLSPAWGDPSVERRVSWPLSFRAGRT